VHNFTELFVYGGLAAIFVPIINIKFALVLLLAISAYDMFAVWKTKHMVKLARFQTKTRLFAGLLVPYKAQLTPSKAKAKKLKTAKAKIQTGVLGGGDMAFPLIFAGAVMQQTTFLNALVISLTAALALLILLIRSRKGRFYPAMPFITAGCIIGYVIGMVV
jgi:presenilin-like A22 family membrane protease